MLRKLLCTSARTAPKQAAEGLDALAAVVEADIALQGRVWVGRPLPHRRKWSEMKFVRIRCALDLMLRSMSVRVVLAEGQLGWSRRDAHVSLTL